MGVSPDFCQICNQKTVPEAYDEACPRCRLILKSRIVAVRLMMRRDSEFYWPAVSHVGTPVERFVCQRRVRDLAARILNGLVAVPIEFLESYPELS